MSKIPEEINKLSFEKAMEELSEIVENLESGNIDLDKSLIGGQVNLFDVLGKVRLSKDINSTNFEIDLSQFQLENEVLFLKIENKNSQYSKILFRKK